MKYRRFGRTGLQVSELVFGGGWVGGILIHGGDETKRAVLRRALEAGINWIDTAPLYGQGRSEEALGWLLEEIEEQPYLSTKVRLDLARLDDIPGQIEESLHASLRRLKRESVDLLQLHNPIGPGGDRDDLELARVLEKNGAADGLDRMRDQGLARFTGLTALGDGAACWAAVESGRFDTAQVYYNLLNPSAGRAMPPAWSGQDFGGLIAACGAKNVAVMAIRVYASGVLATDQRHGREVAVARDSDLDLEAARARAALEALGLDGEGQTPHGTRAQTALRFALANRDIACAVIGLAETDHLEQAIAAETMGPLPPDALAKLEDVYETSFGLA